jgi:ABC-type nitrate/sulfonate/bicarbonate transport system substrate-binding protein
MTPTTPNRRDVFRLLGAAAAAGTLVACGAGTASSGASPAGDAGASLVPRAGAPLTKATVAASNTSVNHMWAQWGIKHGCYRRYGLDVESVGNVSNAVAAMGAGRLDFSASGVATQSGAVQGAPVRVAMVTFRDNLGVYGDPGITSVRGLRGKRILGPDDMIKAILQKYGIDGETGVTWVQNNASVAQSIELVKQGKADAFTGYPPAVFQAEQAGLVQITSVATVYPGSPVSIVGTSAALLRSDPLLVKRFLAGTLDALADLKANKTEVVDFFKAQWGFSQALAEQTYTVIPHDMFTDGKTDDAALRTVLDVTESAQGKTGDIPLNRVWDFSLLNQVLAQRAGGR